MFLKLNFLLECSFRQFLDRSEFGKGPLRIKVFATLLQGRKKARVFHITKAMVVAALGKSGTNAIPQLWTVSL